MAIRSIIADRLRAIPGSQASIGVQRLGKEGADEIDALRKALRELLDASDICAEDLPADEYHAIVNDAKDRARALLPAERSSFTVPKATA